MPDEADTPGLTIEGLSLARLRDLSEIAATVASAAAVGLFETLHEGGDVDAPGAGARPEEVARRLGLDPRATSIVLAALADLGLLARRADGRYALTDTARRHLGNRESPDFEAGGLPHWLENLQAFASLPTVLEAGGPLARPDRADELARYMAAMASAPRDRLERLADRCLERLDDGGDRPLRLLDLGGGPGHISRVFTERGVDAVLFDQPETVDHVGEAYGLADDPSIELVAGDFLDDALPDGPFDVALLSNVVHIYGPDTNRRLLRRVAQRVRPGGVVAVADFLRGRSGRAARFALVMLLRTEEGDTYTEAEVGGWLREAGLRDPRCSDIDEDRQVVTAVRPPSEA